MGTSADSLRDAQARLESVVQIGGVVGDLVDQIDQLRFERRAFIEQIFGELRKFRGEIIARMLDDSFAHFEGQIQSGKIQIALLEFLDDVQRMQIVIETIAVLAHAQIELAFAGVTERRMADVVNERERFHQIAVQAKRAGDGAANLRNFQSVRQAVAKVIGKTRGENLGLRFQAAKRARMHDAIPIARVIVAIGMLRLGISAAARARDIHGIRHLAGHGLRSRADCIFHYCHCSERAASFPSQRLLRTIPKQ